MRAHHMTVSRGLLAGLVALGLASPSALAIAGPLHDAVRAGDAAAADQALAAGADIEETDYFVGPPLLIAVAAGDAAMAARLLDKGADVEAAGERQGARALHLAAELGDTAVVQLLLDRGADVDARNSDARTPLIVAAEWGAADAVDLLLAQGADVAATEAALGQTALHRAANNGKVGIARSLLEHGASVDVVDQTGFTPFMLAAQSQSFSSVGDDALLRLLAEHGADVHKRNAHGQTPLEYAQSRHEGAWGALAEALAQFGP